MSVINRLQISWSIPSGGRTPAGLRIGRADPAPTPESVGGHLRHLQIASAYMRASTPLGRLISKHQSGGNSKACMTGNRTPPFCLYSGAVAPPPKVSRLTAEQKIAKENIPLRWDELNWEPLRPMFGPEGQGARRRKTFWSRQPPRLHQNTPLLSLRRQNSKTKIVPVQSDALQE